MLRGGSVDLGPLLPLLANAALRAEQSYYRPLLALLSGCAATSAQRAQLATALGLDAGSTKSSRTTAC